MNFLPTRKIFMPVIQADDILGTDSSSASETPSNTSHFLKKAYWTKWYAAFKQILPLYVAIHVAFVVTSVLAFLFVLPNYSWQFKKVYTPWQLWGRWDTEHFNLIATQGYNAPKETAFFPLYSLLERGLLLVVHNPLIAGLLISNVAALIMLVVLYRLVLEDFGCERAARTVLYLIVFPSAFFFAAAYNESLFVCLTLLSFYHMRHGYWWLAGLFGLLASLTRSVGVFLLVPFCYEYLRQRSSLASASARVPAQPHGRPQGCTPTRYDGRVSQAVSQKPTHKRATLVSAMFARVRRAIRLDVIGGLCIPAGTALFAFYCYLRFHDPLAFAHAQKLWGRELSLPWYGMLRSIHFIISSSGLYSFQSLRNILDLTPNVFVLLLVILSFVGPWRLPKALWSYAIYAATLYFFFLLYPVRASLYPLQSTFRFMLEVFPAFIVLAGIGKYRTFHLSYLMVSGAMLFFFLTQFLTGYWIT